VKVEATPHAALWDAAVAVLRANDLGDRTKPAPRLYPHQWSWDSAFIAIGLAHVDPDRALAELESLFAAQWADGRVPHIVFNPAAHDYFPGPERWACATLAATAPRAPATSGLIQPPVHALAVWHIYQTAPDPALLLARLRGLYPRLLAWHRYLATARDPEGSGLVTTYHPWESTDNSPRWDAPLANVEVGLVPPYVRHDLKHVADPAERPTQAEYDRYLWLVESLKAARYDDIEVQRAHPFLVKDVLCSAIFAAANEALGRLADTVGAPDAEKAEIARWGLRAGGAVQQQVDADEHLALDLDLRTGAPIRVRTCAGLAPLLLPGLERRAADALVAQLAGPSFAGAPGFAYPVVPSTAPGSPGFSPRAYWRGPSWPVIDWLLWWALRRQGYAAQAADLRRANLDLLARPEARFGEYFEPYTGEQLGSPQQSWTAAVALDWLAHDDPEAQRSAA
jgi:hypothetical protein